MINPVFVSVDTPDPVEARSLLDSLDGLVGGVKLGLEFFTAQGPAGIRAVAPSGLPLFLDLKLHDIPNTVAGAVRSVAPLAPSILTVHAQGGGAMIRAAADAAAQAAVSLGVARPRVVAVTMLTSLDQEAVTELGIPRPVADQALLLARLAIDAGADGVVCSPHEVAVLRAELGPTALLVVPGIRPAGAALGDQKRVMTPRQAMDAGAGVLVIGRPITAARNPADAARAILEELAA